MDEKNKNNESSENTDFTKFLKGEFEKTPTQENKKEDNKSIKITLTLLCCFFAISMISALYIVFNPNKNVMKNEITEIKDSAESVKNTLSFLKNTKKDGAYILKIRGVIQEGTDGGAFSARVSASTIAKRIRSLADKKEIKALILDINSPGGTVGAVQDIYNAILYFRTKNKPVVALMRDVAASGGFYIAMAADKVIAQPGTLTGSIGVIMQTTNAQGLLEKIGIQMGSIKSGKNKDTGAIYREMTEEEKALLQEMIDDTYLQFLTAVQNGRPNMDKDTVRLYADGRVFTGSRAKSLGFVDELGGEEVAKKYLEEKTGIKDIKIVNQKNGLMSDFFGSFVELSESKLSINKLESLATPRISYLVVF